MNRSNSKSEDDSFFSKYTLLGIEISEAADLKVTETNGDNFARLTFKGMGKNKQVTTKVQVDRNPKWMERFNFILEEEISEIKLEAIDKNKLLSDHIIGETMVDLKNYLNKGLFGKNPALWLTLKDPKSGKETGRMRIIMEVVTVKFLMEERAQKEIIIQKECDEKIILQELLKAEHAKLENMTEEKREVERKRADEEKARFKSEKEKKETESRLAGAELRASEEGKARETAEAALVEMEKMLAILQEKCKTAAIREKEHFEREEKLEQSIRELEEDSQNLKWRVKDNTGNHHEPSFMISKVSLLLLIIEICEARNLADTGAGLDKYATVSLKAPDDMTPKLSQMKTDAKGGQPNPKWNARWSLKTELDTTLLTIQVKDGENFSGETSIDLNQYKDRGPIGLKKEFWLELRNTFSKRGEGNSVGEVRIILEVTSLVSNRFCRN